MKEVFNVTTQIGISDAVHHVFSSIEDADKMFKHFAISLILGRERGYALLVSSNIGVLSQIVLN